MSDTPPHALDPEGRLRLVLFDCDGVLIDSEAPAIRLIARRAAEHGAPLSFDEAMERHAGKALGHIQHELEAEYGVSLGLDWVARIQDDLVALMREEAEPVPGAPAMLEAMGPLGLPFRVGSNSSRAEMTAKFGRVGFTAHFPEDRVHSAREMGRPKPDPHVYLHAAALEGVSPSECVVVEDSDPGVQAAHDAGMACILLRPHGPMPPHDWPGLVHIRHLDELVPLLARVKRTQTS
ncbi:HAD family hydrolase [Acidomonas methanolica]|uniref:HAD family hydrolase n=1 Tax=Acidomonas methanolica TaxID=437 RepID=UPI00211A3EC1|nr:HAD family phosphatase [Acidomonas methanolica]MCQ9154129.1 HAD family phosphatase [Acidomonas methanolica]